MEGKSSHIQTSEHKTIDDFVGAVLQIIQETKQLILPEYTPELHRKVKDNLVRIHVIMARMKVVLKEVKSCCGPEATTSQLIDKAQLLVGSPRICELNDKIDILLADCKAWRLARPPVIVR
jgi:hypothetical protein